VELFSSVTGSLSATVIENDKITGSVTANGTAGFEGVTVGGEVKARVDEEQRLDDYNVAGQYQRGALTLAFNSERKLEVVRTSAFYTPSLFYSLGVELVVDDFNHLSTAPLSKILNFVTQYEYTSDITTKFRWSSDGEVGLALEHRLRNPNLSLLLSSNFKTKGNDVRFDRFGVGFTLGDY